MDFPDCFIFHMTYVAQVIGQFGKTKLAFQIVRPPAEAPQFWTPLTPFREKSVTRGT